MSGHSKWHSIRHKKDAADAKRGKVFTRHAKLIEIAAREGGGGDPDTNARLRTAIENARAGNVPRANIDRAIRKGAGELKDAAQTVAVTYEAFGPAGSAYLIECLTDNKNRTLPNVKTILGKNGGRLADSGSVNWIFEQKGVIVAQCESRIANREGDELALRLIDAGAEDIDIRGDVTDVVTDKTRWPEIRDILGRAGYEIRTAGLAYVPKQTVNIADLENAKKVLALMEALEDDDDVSGVHTNAEIDENILAAMR